jgi:DNA helicase IV
MERLQDTVFFKTKKIKVLDGTDKETVSDKHICVYPIDIVKGMEFDVVFFHNIDKFNNDDILKRYIYVGVSRAAFFLGVTMVQEKEEISKYFVKDKDWFKI